MTAELLREAAAKMREQAEAATPGPWFAVASGIEGAGTVFHDQHVLHNDAEHIASWHPAVALAVADWLEGMADAHDLRAMEGKPYPPHAGHWTWPLAVARAYLGRES